MDAFTSSGNYLGTDRLERALTNAEKNQLAKLLRQHDFAGASLVGLRFAYKLTRSRERARDLVGRVNLRLVRQGWDPNRVSLVKALCRFVWSEFTHAVSETETARRAEEAFLREHAVQTEPPPAAPQRGDPLRPPPPAPPVAPSPEQHVLRLAEERAAEARRAARLAEERAHLVKLRKELQAKKDEVNLVYLEQLAAGVDDVQKMAADTGRPVEDFYAAQKRRRRAVLRLLEEKNGVPPGGEENE